jgi:hypothetical protein
MMIHPFDLAHDPRASSPEPHSTHAPKTASIRSESRAASRQRSGARTPACNLVQIELVVVNSGTSRQHPVQVTQQNSLESQARDDADVGVMKRAARASDSSPLCADPKDKDDEELSLRAVVATGLSLERSNDSTKHPNKTQSISAGRAINAQHSFTSSTQPSMIGEGFRDETPDCAPDEPPQPRSLTHDRQRGSKAHEDKSFRLPGTGGTRAFSSMIAPPRSTPSPATARPVPPWPLPPPPSQTQPALFTYPHILAEESSPLYPPP